MPGLDVSEPSEDGLGTEIPLNSACDEAVDACSLFIAWQQPHGPLPCGPAPFQDSSYLD